MANMSRQGLGDGDFEERRRRADHDDARHDLEGTNSQKRVNKITK